MRSRRFTKAELVDRGGRIAAAVVAGRPPRQVAQEFMVPLRVLKTECGARGLVFPYEHTVRLFRQMPANHRLMVLQVLRGAAPGELSASLGCSEDLIRHVCAGAGIEWRPGTRRLAKPVSQSWAGARAVPYPQLAAAVASGLTARQVATKFGVTRATVYNALLATGVAPPSALAGAPTNRREAVLELASRGMDASEISRRLGVSRTSVRYHFQKGGLRHLTAYDRVESLRIVARHQSLRGIEPQSILNGRHVRALQLLRDSDLNLCEIGARLGYGPRKVFDVWTRALHRLAVPSPRDQAQIATARRRVLSSGISLRALGHGKHGKLLRSMRDSDLCMTALARNSRLSVSAVWHIWFLALDRAALAAARPESVPS